MNAKPHVLDSSRYEAIARDALIQAGLSPEEADQGLASRWPLGKASDVIDECRARGLVVTEDDLKAFLAHDLPPTFKDGRPVTPDSIGWPKFFVDELLAWCIAEGRGTPAGRTVLTVEHAFACLRSAHLPIRIMGGEILGTAFGAGCALQGESREDFELLIAPEFSDLLGKAMAGESEAVDELERLITTDPGEAFAPATKLEKAREGIRH